MAIPNVPIISSDSHVMEPVDLWKKGVPEKFRETAPLFPPHKVGLIEYCSADTNRLIGIPAVPVYNIDNGVKELERCRKAGLKGAIIWQAPHPDLPFKSSHYDKLWAACPDLDTPVSLPILTGHSYNKDKTRQGG